MYLIIPILTMDYTKDEHFSDFQIKVGDTTYYVHRIMLLLRSEYFKVLFNSKTKETIEKVVTFDEEYKDTMPVILSWCYNTELTDELEDKISKCDIMMLIKHLSYFRINELYSFIIPLFQTNYDKLDLLSKIIFLHNINLTDEIDKFKINFVSIKNLEQAKKIETNTKKKVEFNKYNFESDEDGDDDFVQDDDDEEYISALDDGLHHTVADTTDTLIITYEDMQTIPIEIITRIMTITKITLIDTLLIEWTKIHPECAGEIAIIIANRIMFANTLASPGKYNTKYNNKRPVWNIVLLLDIFFNSIDKKYDFMKVLIKEYLN